MTARKGGARQQNKPAPEMFRGDFVLVVSVGDYRKPRPALVVQSDLYNGTHHSVTICLVTSTLVDAPLFRIPIKPLKRNGLSVASQVMVDKIQSARRVKVSLPLWMPRCVAGWALKPEVRRVSTYANFSGIVAYRN
ncbi:MAG: type II toxin-antitoxin system PemK/MazF family toxin [Rhodocyclaceae bacterium]|nr:type II toxin-antitoxin system PemK/MazF family toxin [Rhodocyclaceae bacterium]MCA3024094.1 type II toxin-antitoxin system PemK/MazF family toxin [Rhodocyclaceae bacterium]MCA3033431.1 type II toxin-antitoxin system PemK/MazF family toxin [Rhodocyclaceae bacterium]MCA3038674.1 type II toxin-antitoxin system PemK/MazF family toxin [Rhodocyclaceae bacterium]MCA3041159.1 type II toxin-antitoxin system PemK/MazF family toxin [Rhodocyclaceae bacterium]